MANADRPRMRRCRRLVKMHQSCDWTDSGGRGMAWGQTNIRLHLFGIRTPLRNSHTPSRRILRCLNNPLLKWVPVDALLAAAVIVPTVPAAATKQHLSMVALVKGGAQLGVWLPWWKEAREVSNIRA
ncbi:hypothetical protein F4680DRAFT_452758 [Xylaria scruposa]|nr:hypothetical protein F4680DRAFT_452758 [Xylaria scruposa]